DDVRLQAFRIPVHDRMDLPDAVPFRPLDPLRIRTRQCLLAADPRNPRVVGSQRTLERLDLADVAAAIWIAFPQVRALLDRLVSNGDDLRALEPQAVALDQAVPRLVGLPEEELRIELDDRDVEPELAEDHMHEDGGLALPRAGQAHSVTELLVRPEQNVLGRHRLDVRKLECRHGRQAAPP